jgi:hypothetical protein
MIVEQRAIDKWELCFAKWKCENKKGDAITIYISMFLSVFVYMLKNINKTEYRLDQLLKKNEYRLENKTKQFILIMNRDIINKKKTF